MKETLESVRARLASARAELEAARVNLDAAKSARGAALLAPDGAERLKISAAELTGAERRLQDASIVVSTLAGREADLVRAAAAAELRSARSALSELEDRRQAVFSAVWDAKKELEQAEQAVGIAERLKSEWNMQLDNTRARVRLLESQAVQNG